MSIEMRYDTTQYHSRRAFIEQALDPEATVREAVRRGEWTVANAYEEAQEFLVAAIALDSDRDVSEDASWRMGGRLTVEDVAVYILALIAEEAPDAV